MAYYTRLLAILAETSPFRNLCEIVAFNLMKSSLFAFLLISLSISAHSQVVGEDSLSIGHPKASGDSVVPWSKKDRFTRGKWGYKQGYLIEKNGQKLICLTSGNNDGVSIVLNTEEEKFYRPKEAREFLEDTVRYISSGDYFNEVIADVDGTLICKRILSPYQSKDIIYYYIRRPGEMELTQMSRIAWGKKLNKYFSDCPAMQSKLKAVNLRYRDEDMKLIPTWYAQVCRQKSRQ